MRTARLDPAALRCISSAAPRGTSLIRQLNQLDLPNKAAHLAMNSTPLDSACVRPLPQRRRMQKARDRETDIIFAPEWFESLSPQRRLRAGR